MISSISKIERALKANPLKQLAVESTTYPLLTVIIVIPKPTAEVCSIYASSLALFMLEKIFCLS
jgi:hypothetical protein